MSDKERVRRRLVGGGVVTLVMVGLLAILTGVPTRGVDLLPFAWLAAGGVALLLAGRYERLPLGVVPVGWPRVAAVGLAILAVGSSTLGFLQLLANPSMLGLLQVGLALFVALLLAFGALECLLGGVGLDEETFVVE
ncbi:hypothetical protein [Natronobacterium gregoryi]|uniref:Uncharacterized protein n=2 Tax=Natronobacterium gregoryi TaxID=44930 RepID=L0AHC2_NATGS|nr:hypothetical protein [Natronobacterium gregoryi]AFZ73298.1 hypothetical protein Natgr_2116 [Natronobacterium gregoryi SP2]ELY73942.1 hypothetical protein C490_00825 [Natronobacterium gregoryi SP2]PLK19906.1 hypothetical protein CYV19_12430 [Natronobacterium gregoryi SP2]SFJ37939.1 hypothetical protein SAMN05443661_12537 [Natronobacterium gregoryi]